jgi:hypothetical protein
MASAKTMSLAGSVDALAARLPDADPSKAELRTRIATLAQECGCTMGAVFFAGASVVAVAYFLATGQLGIGPGLLAIGFVFAASLLGKLVGLSVARIRLLALRGSLTTRLSSFEVECVHLH